MSSCIVADSTFHDVWHSSGQVVRIDEHCALIPVGLFVNGTTLRPKDALPVAGHTSREATVKFLKRLAEILQIQLPALSMYLPHRLFPCNRNLLKNTGDFARSLAAVAYCKTLDKGPGLLWAVCRRFM